MRSFYIENEVGERLSLSNHAELWLGSPKNLGMEMDRSYESIEPGFFEVSSSGEKQKPISGVLQFTGLNPYKSFREITNWLMVASSLKFVYCPYGVEEYYRDINIDAIDKAEKKLSRLLECAATITPLTPWYEKSHLVFLFSQDQNDKHKTYNYQYPFTYAASSLLNSVDFQIDGHYPGEIELRATGPFDSPVLALTKSTTKEMLGKLDLNGVVFGGDETLLFSSRVTDPGVWKISNEEKIDLIDSLELNANTESFFKIPSNIPLTATMTVNGVVSGVATMDVIKYYRLR